MTARDGFEFVKEEVCLHTVMRVILEILVYGGIVVFQDILESSLEGRHLSFSREV
jgi:hypothetical protein